jgi:hypothetical protein
MCTALCCGRCVPAGIHRPRRSSSVPNAECSCAQAPPSTPLVPEAKAVVSAEPRRAASHRASVGKQRHTGRGSSRAREARHGGPHFVSRSRTCRLAVTGRAYAHRDFVRAQNELYLSFENKGFVARRHLWPSLMLLAAVLGQCRQISAVRSRATSRVGDTALAGTARLRVARRGFRRRSVTTSADSFERQKRDTAARDSTPDALSPQSIHVRRWPSRVAAVDAPEGTECTLLHGGLRGLG